MYSSGRRFGLGDTAVYPALTFVPDMGSSDPGSGGNGGAAPPCQGLPLTDPCWITMTPTVVTTPGQPDTLPRPMYGPQAIGPTSVPQVLSPIVAHASPDWRTVLFLGGVALFATRTLMKKGRR